MGDEIIFATGPILAGIASHVDLFEIGQFGQANDAVVKFRNIDKIDSHIQFFQTLAALDVLYSANVVESQIEVLQLLQFIQIFHLLDDVILQVHNFEMPTQDVQILYFDELLLMQGDLYILGVTSSRVVSRISLCSDRFLRSSYVILDIN